MRPHVISGHTFTVDITRYRFDNAKILGAGRFGVVSTATDKLQDGRKFAIKRIRPFANDEWDARHSLREVRLMQVLGSHPNMVELYDLSLNEAKSELYMMMKLMDCDLHQILQSKQPLTEVHHRCFTKQMLEDVKAMHEIGIIHRDLKPANLLVSMDCRLRIADFGNACYVNGEISVDEDDGGGSLWYRCPECLIASFRRKNKSIDLWSIGCILAELFRLSPLFPGDDDQNQAKRIFELLGYVSNQQLGFEISEGARSFLDEHCRSGGKSIKKVVPNASPGAIDLITALLSIDPSTRPTAAQALSFDFLLDAKELCYYGKNYLSRPPKELFEFEQEKYSLDDLKRFIVGEVRISAIVQNLARNQVVKGAQALKAAHFSLLVPMARDGAEHFAWNNVLEYLTLKDVVSVLAIFSQPSFVPTRALLEDTIRRALRGTIITFRPNVTMASLSFGMINSTTGDIVSEITLTSGMLQSINTLVKSHCAHECVPTPYVSPTQAAALTPAVAAASSVSIVMNGNMCVFRRHASAADRDRRSVQIAFPACSCQANECNRIVLWDCSVCKNPCTECGTHATFCDACEKQACGGCFVGDDICKNCGFQCKSCHATIPNSDQENNGYSQPFVCEGLSKTTNATPCPFGKGLGLICWNCEDNGTGGRRCGECSRMACQECNVIRDCERCGDSCCIFCETFEACATCNFSVCNGCVGFDDRNIWTCEVCKVTYCTDCKEMWYCENCVQAFCCSCCPKMPCEACEGIFCANCVTVNQCGVCKTTQCANCKPMAQCDHCEEAFCICCRDVTTCGLCKKSTCHNCPLLPPEGSSRGHHPLECSDCLESYCGDCRKFTECSICSKLTCAECDETKSCDKCKVVFCGDCEKDLCKQCAHCGGFECASILDFGHCGQCNESYCHGCQPVKTCDKCDRQLCLECHPEPMTHCEQCDKMYCLYCKRDSVFCKSCNGCEECVNECAKGCCDKCEKTHCDDCRPVLECHVCLEAWCQDCISCDPQKSMLQCEVCDFAYCSSCVAVNQCDHCETTQCEECTAMAQCDQCEKTVCVDCGDVTTCALCRKSTCDKCQEPHGGDCQSMPKCYLCAKGCCRDCSSRGPQYSILPCTECSKPFCSDCGYIHEIGTNPHPHEESDMYLTALMDTGGGLLAATEGPVTRSAVRIVRDAHEQQPDVVAEKCHHP